RPWGSASCGACSRGPASCRWSGSPRPRWPADAGRGCAAGAGPRSPPNAVSGERRRHGCGPEPGRRRPPGWENQWLRVGGRAYRRRMPILEARSLSKRFRRPDKDSGFKGAMKHLVQRRYKNFTAVDAVDLEIEPGESVAYVGPNGAGKSTTVKLLTGILKPTEGTVRVMGRDPHTERIA